MCSVLLLQKALTLSRLLLAWALSLHCSGVGVKEGSCQAVAAAMALHLSDKRVYILVFPACLHYSPIQVQLVGLKLMTSIARVAPHKLIEENAHSTAIAAAQNFPEDSDMQVEALSLLLKLGELSSHNDILPALAQLAVLAMTNHLSHEMIQSTAVGVLLLACLVTDRHLLSF